jgi:hypothetical protein
VKNGWSNLLRKAVAQKGLFANSDLYIEEIRGTLIISISEKDLYPTK